MVKITVYKFGYGIDLLGMIEYAQVEPVAALHMARILGEKIGSKYLFFFYPNYGNWVGEKIGEVETDVDGIEAVNKIVCMIEKIKEQEGGDIHG